jgi:mono/diheme cytochrome c family protein
MNVQNAKRLSLPVALGCLWLLSVPVAFAASDTVSIELPADMMNYKPGKGVELANQYCGMCHAADYLYMQPVMNKEKWVGVVKKMKKVFGCTVEHADISPLANYLAQQNAAK